MAMDGCGNCLKYTFGFVNLIILIGGGVLLGVGITALVGDNAVLSNLSGAELYTGAAILITVAGGLIVLISFLGCCGAFQESKCLLGTFFCLVLILFILVAAGAIAGFVLGGDGLLEDISKEMKESISAYNSDEKDRDAWDFLQENFRCCGVDGPANWAGIIGPGRVPPSCCRKDSSGKPLSCDAGSNSYSNGCLSAMKEFVSKNSTLFGGIAIAVAVLLVLAMIFSCAIMKSIF